MDTTIEDVIKNIPRRCISAFVRDHLLILFAGGGWEKVSEYKLGEASINQEFVSDENQYFVLHDSKGFEPGDSANFDLATRFLRERHRKKFLKDRLHVIWLCTETPRTGGRVLEEGDKKLMALAHKLETPVVVVFTKYDLLVLSKQLEEEEDCDMDKETLRETSKVNASKAFAVCVRSLDNSTAGLKIPTPPYINISVTCEIVHERLKAIAQRASFPVKIEACVDKGINCAPS
ncbi:hypothetical protein HD554DRAFT_2081784 [Boletus coccyginus]|nr:hypothetical protein HD554DRAFT_2136777 [Boletus coccyginus]KAI9570409.1 hypothetical protein HD554DRAFT_2081784 [Boletus coccyginus]